MKDEVVYKLVSGGREIRKIYRMSKQEYVIDQETIIKNISNTPSLSAIDFNALQINISLVKKISAQENGLYEYSVSSELKTFRKSSASKFSQKEAKSVNEPAKWVGFRDKYYCAVFKPEFDNVSYKILPASETQIGLSIQTKPIALNPGAQVSLKGFYYFGPQDMEILSKQGLGDYVVFSQYAILDFFSKIVLKIVYFLHKFIPSLGLCIILVSIIIYGLMYPLTMSGLLSMKKMQSLQPKIAKIKEQYKNNPQKLNQEVMALYKENSINPFGGCLPLILQMPVFIGLYQALWRSVIFQGQGFLWIKDLSMPDRLFILPKSLPIIGNNINILPLFMMVAMFFQQKLSSKSMAPTDETQIMQQKMMMWFFPIFLGVLFYNFGSGLNLYFTVFYILSTLSQLKMSKMNVTKDEPIAE
ncbi:MAG: membrane protein insertase YidC [Candidatus Omnitrophica bacterium]|nr:membrane protein insertase YidC [Candidatus Omnitrophota bacterium]